VTLYVVLPILGKNLEVKPLKLVKKPEEKPPEKLIEAKPAVEASVPKQKVYRV
jgi:hypothetical protein